MALAERARSLYAGHVLAGLTSLVDQLLTLAEELLLQAAMPQVAQQRADTVRELRAFHLAWVKAVETALFDAHEFGARTLFGRSLTPSVAPDFVDSSLTLVDDETMEVEIVAARLGMALASQAGSEFNDLSARVLHLEGSAELPERDTLQPQLLARVAVESWQQVGLSAFAWNDLLPAIHQGLSDLAMEAYHEVNRWLIEEGVLPEIDLRPLLRRAKDVGEAGLRRQEDTEAAAPVAKTAGGRANPATTAAPALMGTPADAQALLEGLRGLVSDAVGVQPGSNETPFPATWLVDRPSVLGAPEGAGSTPRISADLARAIEQAQQGIVARTREALADQVEETVLLNDSHWLRDLEVQRRDLKSATHDAAERSIIEVVALMFQSILTEDRLPSELRVWFARLQMPVLRVAMQDKDFFGTLEHPARKLIDRMGSVVLGLTGGSGEDEAIFAQVRGAVQVIEAYPDAGAQAFVSAMKDFEAFLEKHFREDNERSRKGVSLAQQLEQREALAIQYTIELRRMLDDLPVQEGVRQFMFGVWADVMAASAVRYGPTSPEMRDTRHAAGELVWSAGAKVTREQRAEVLRKLPGLLKSLREGMTRAGLDVKRQDDRIKALNEALAAGFKANAAVIPPQQLENLAERLSALEQFIPEDASKVDVGELMGQDLPLVADSELDVINEGGQEPMPATQAWARELAVGSWYTLDHAQRQEAVQLVWHGMRGRLVLFVTATGRGKLFAVDRLAAYLQAGLMKPAQEEALTIKATRQALNQIQADPARLLR